MLIRMIELNQHDRKRMGWILVETGAYRDLPDPVILTSGELGVYYINTEKILQDGGAWEREVGTTQEAYDYFVSQLRTEGRELFAEAVDILTRNVRRNIPRAHPGFGFPNAISGGERRDWVFSMPVAFNLGLPHVTLYKQKTGTPDKIEIINPNGGLERVSPQIEKTLEGLNCVHIADLMTEGSSAYRFEGCETLGWIPMLRERGAEIRDFYAVVDGLQGGRERLAGIRVGRKFCPVETRAFVEIDKDFLESHSTFPGIAMEYLRNPGAWSESYLKKQGALAFVDSFDPEGKKLDRARKFLERYEAVLRESGRLSELDDAVHRKYIITLSEIIGGVKLN